MKKQVLVPALLTLFAALSLIVGCAPAPTALPSAPAAQSAPATSATAVAPTSTPAGIPPAVVVPAVVAPAVAPVGVHPQLQSQEGLTIITRCADGRADQCWPLDPQGTQQPIKLADTEVREYSRIASSLDEGFPDWVTQVEKNAGKQTQTIILNVHAEVKGGVCISNCGGQAGLDMVVYDPNAAAIHLPDGTRRWLLAGNVSSPVAYDQLSINFRRAQQWFPTKEIVGNIWVPSLQKPITLFYQDGKARFLRPVLQSGKLR